MRNANEMAGIANSLPALRGGQADPKALKLQRKLMETYRQQVEAFGADPELGGRFPEERAEMVYFYARMCEDSGEREEARQADRRLLEILAGVAEPGNESLKRELTVERLQSDAEAWRFLENLANMLGSILQNELKDLAGAEQVQRELMELKGRIKGKGGQ